ncbi:hypothetical protein ELG83_10500 [Rhizobium leguminosarum]|uniref:hypothetical protein n=1 Tax=Rhizobium leguminosarum TaxID=384 RepID=UPI001030979A|nr:hypothetical protein [Rhizobium leguminosarum]TBF94520.1 hypothetical protein ELG83_10500 [Rhizobium leguminosarum]
MAFQFARVELYSRKGKEGRGTGFVFDEVSRVPSASMHVKAPVAPIVVAGLDPDALRALHDDRAVAARQEVKGGKLRAVRQDQNTLAAIVLSHPATMDEYRSRPEVAADVRAWEQRSVAWLRVQYGDQLVSVLRHEDESHPHLHAYILPDDPGMKAGPLHPGFRAKAAVTAAGPRPGEDEKAHSKRANGAYQEAMRGWLDDYHAKVGQPSGLLRLGPRKRHLTRAAWHEEKRQAVALKEALAKAETLEAKGAAFVDRTKEEAAKLRADAARRADAAKAAEASARKREETARGAMEKAARDTKAAKRLMGLGGALRGFWDGLRKSKVAARIREELRPTVERWQRAEAAAAARAVAESDRRQQAEKRASVLLASAAELGAQRDELRARLARYEPAAVAPVLPRPHP